MSITKKLVPKTPDQCVTVQIDLCGDAKKRVLEFQSDYLKNTGRYIGKERAIIKLLSK